MNLLRRNGMVVGLAALAAGLVETRQTVPGAGGRLACGKRPVPT
jgi:hypothetical protein